MQLKIDKRYYSETFRSYVILGNNQEYDFDIEIHLYLGHYIVQEGVVHYHFPAHLTLKDICYITNTEYTEDIKRLDKIASKQLIRGYNTRWIRKAIEILNNANTITTNEIDNLYMDDCYLAFINNVDIKYKQIPVMVTYRDIAKYNIEDYSICSYLLLNKNMQTI